MPKPSFEYWHWPDLVPDDPGSRGLGQLSQLIGRTALLAEGGLRVRVQIDDVRQCYGRNECRIHPLHGSGLRWVRRDRLTLDDKD